jgi:formyl-CoA transferase
LPGQGPVRVGIPIADLTAGLFCAIGIMTALLEREVSGEGQWVSTSLLQAQIFMLDFQAARWLQMQEVAKQAGNNHPTSIPTGVYKTKDGHINIASTGQKMWELTCRCIEMPELINHPDYSSGALRSKNRDALNALIEAKTLGKTSAEWIDIFNKAGVPSGPIYTIDQTFADEQVKHLGIAQDATKPNGETQTFVGQPFKLSRTPSKIVATPPNQGQHTDEVFKEFGFSDSEIAKLHEAKAV